jgi:hypothetical protein
VIEMVYAIVVSIFLWVAVALFLLKMLWNASVPFLHAWGSSARNRAYPVAGVSLALSLDVTLMLAVILLLIVTPPAWLPWDKSLLVLCSLLLPFASYVLMILAGYVVLFVGLWTRRTSAATERETPHESS